MKKYQRYKPKQSQAAHMDDWLMTYADMITLLLCFFMVFLSTTLIKKENEAKVQKPMIEQRSITPVVLEGAPPVHNFPRIIFMRPEEAEEPLPAAKDAQEQAILHDLSILLGSEKYRDYKVALDAGDSGRLVIRLERIGTTKE